MPPSVPRSECGGMKLRRRLGDVKEANRPRRAPRACGEAIRASAILSGMNIPFLDSWRKRHAPARGVALADAVDRDPEGLAELLSECELLRAHAESAGVTLDDSPMSLEALDQLQPRWREDPELLPWLGNDAGLYLGTVVVRAVEGAGWWIRSDGQPVVRLANGREIDVVEAGQSWAADGAPELSQLYGELAEN